jgi:hypothetical protein
MGYVSSKALIQAHALFLFILAVYLTRSPEVITDSDIVYLLGEAVKVVGFLRSVPFLPSSFSVDFQS